jgi:UDP:flavonoid glycosyltransferase YjiC (YdhE family)
MKITFIAFGTRGDVQPAIVLGKALQAQGHRVRLLAGKNFKPWIESHGLETATTEVDIQAVMLSEGGQDWIEHGNNPIKQMQVIRRLLKKDGLRMAQDAWAACQDADAVFCQFTSITYATSIAEKLQCPVIAVLFQPPLIASYDGPAVINAPFPTRRSIVNYWFSKYLIQSGGWLMYGDVANAFRQTLLGLPPQTRDQNISAMLKVPTLNCYSPNVTPHSADWPAHVHTTGYLFLDEGLHWPPPADLQNFLNAGDPPVCIGFGSMTGRNVAGFTRLVINALNGRRAILLSGWSGLGGSELPANIFRLDSAPHEWLFPRMAAVVHHGGAGTTAAGLRAGIPNIIVPHMADQPYWGVRVEALGVGPQAIPRPQLTAERLAAAITAATTNPDMRQRAAALGQKIRAEDGVGQAVKMLEQYLK